MKIVLLGKSPILNKLILPQYPSGNYWISEDYKGKEYKIANIVGNGKNLKLLGNNLYQNR